MLYKCRRCGEITKNTHVPNANIALTCMIHDFKEPKCWFGAMPKLLDIHGCKDGNLGIADLIGCETDKEDLKQRSG